MTAVQVPLHLATSDGLLSFDFDTLASKPLMWGIGCLDCHQVQVPWWCYWQLFNRNWLMCWSWGILSGRLYYYHILLQVLIHVVDNVDIWPEILTLCFMALRPMHRFMCLMYPSPATLVTPIYKLLNWPNEQEQTLHVAIQRERDTHVCCFCHLSIFEYPCQPSCHRS